MRILDFIAGVTFVAALVAFPFSIYNFRRHEILSALVFAIPLLVCMAASDTSQEFAQGKILEKLETISESYRISINAKPAPNPKDVLSALRALRWLSPHHSSPTKRINVEVSDGSRHILLSLARDSNNPKEYWVFYPKYRNTRYDEIGRIITPVFDNY